MSPNYLLKIILIVPEMILYVIISWLLIHVLAFLGIVIVVAFPIWWAIMPRATVCLGCTTGKRGASCNICKQKIPLQGPLYPRTFKSMITNVAIIFIATLFSVGFLFLEQNLLNYFGFPKEDRNVSFVINDNGQYKKGEIFPMKIQISGIKVPVNVIQADISYDPAILEIADISVKDSFAKIFVQKEINNTLGYARLTGGLPNPGYSGTDGIFGTIYFKAKESGAVNVTFLSSSRILASDGTGKDVLSNFPKASYVILPESISTQEEELQKQYISSQVLGVSIQEDPTVQVYFNNAPKVNAKEVLGIENSTINSNEVARKNNPAKTLSLLDYIVHLDNILFKAVGNFMSFK